MRAGMGHACLGRSLASPSLGGPHGELNPERLRLIKSGLPNTHSRPFRDLNESLVSLDQPELRVLVGIIVPRATCIFSGDSPCRRFVFWFDPFPSFGMECRTARSVVTSFLPHSSDTKRSCVTLGGRKHLKGD